MSVTAQRGKKTHSSSYRFHSHISEGLEYYSELLRRKKTSIIEEALEQYFEKEKKKQEEAKILKKLLKAGDESGDGVSMPTLEEIKALAKERYPQNHKT